MILDEKMKSNQVIDNDDAESVNSVGEEHDGMYPITIFDKHYNIPIDLFAVPGVQKE